MFGNTKPFGTASAFGASTFGNTSTPFGQSNTAFGAKPATNNVFGSSAFGVQTPAAPMSGGLFGSSTPTTGSGLFGQPSNAFGAPASTSSGGFGFGGTSNSGGLFGSATPSTQSTGLFGATSTSAFGTARPAFGGFGTTNTGTSLFGQNTSTGSGLFGSSGVSGFNTTATSGTTIKFNPLTGTDTMMKNGSSNSIGTRHQCITCMKEYENKSLEELRVEDYAANRKGGSSTTTLGFGNTTQPATGGLFGTPAAASTSAFSFGNTTQSKPLFGTTGMTNTFGSSGGGLFGQTTQNQNSGLFGKTVGFGAPSVSTAPAFSFGGTNNTSLFGQNNQQKPLFGQNSGTTGLFGNTASTQAAGFGTSTGFGGFGATTQQTGGLFGAKPTGFGTTSTTTTNTFSFGNTNNMSGGGLFGQKSAAPAFGTAGFGTQTSGFGSFGATPVSGTNLFSQNKTATSGFGATGNIFGGGLGTGFGTPSTFSMGLGSNTGTGLFGNTAANKPTGFNFGGANTSAFNFSGTNPNASNFNFGGASTQLPSNDPNNSVALQQIQQQILAMTANPFGDNPLFRNSIKDSSRETEVLKPTNPSAQKALLNDSHHKVDLLPTAKIKPKPCIPVSSGKVFLFDGLEDEEPSLEAAFVPKRSIKKLVLKNIGSTNSSLTLTSDVSSNQPTRIDVSISLKGPLNTSLKSLGESTNQDLPLTTDLTKNLQEEERNVSGSGEIVLSSEVIQDRFISNPDIVPNMGTNLNDSIAALHTNKQKYLGKTYNICSDTSDEVGNQSLEESLNTSSAGEHASKSHPTGIILTKTGYYTVPSLNEMLSMINENDQCFVTNFTIGRKGYGKVVFPGVTEVTGLNLDEIVNFQKKEITIYPDDDKKPPVGEELNKKAEVTLENIWPSDKTTHTLIKDPERLEKMEYREKIKNSTVKLGAKFVDYIPETGSWIFEVEHFSKYGLEDSDEEMDVSKPPEKKVKSANEIGNVNGIFNINSRKQITASKSASLALQDHDMEITGPLIQPSHSNFVNESSLLSEFSAPVKQLYSSVINAEQIQDMKASFFDEDKEDDIWASPIYTGKRDSFFHPKEGLQFVTENTYSTLKTQEHDISTHGVIKKFNLIDPENDMSCIKKLDTSSQKSFTNVPISSANFPDCLSEFPIIQSSLQIDPPKSKVAQFNKLTLNGIYLKPFEKSSLFKKQHLLVDAGYFMGRSFRVGWTSNSAFTSLNSLKEDKRDLLQEVLHKILKSSNKTSLKPNFTVLLKKLPLHADVEPCDKSQNYLVEALNLQLKNSKSTVENSAPFFVPKPGVESTHELANLFEKQLKNADLIRTETELLRQCVYVWDLLVSLWGKVKGLQSDEDLSSFALQMARREALSQWLIKVTDLDLSKKIANTSENEYLKKIFLYLTGRKTKEAIQVAQKYNDFRMSLLLSQAEGTTIVRKLVGKQLLNWEQSDAYTFLKHDRILIYTLLSGMLIWDNKNYFINCCQNLSWKQALSLQLWYLCNPNSSIQEAITYYDISFQNKYSSPPHPPYIKNLTVQFEESDSVTEYDTCYHILKLYCDRTHRFDMLLMPETYTADHLDYRLSWLLHLALSSIGHNIPVDLACTLHYNFASQLESLDLWQWAVFVVLHHPDSTWRTKNVKDILLRHVSLEQNMQLTKKEIFLLESLMVPEKWIYEAKAIKASNAGHRAEEAWYLLKAGSWNKCHNIVIKYLASNAVINEDFDYLMKYLGELSSPEKSCTIQDWCSGGQVYIDYMHMCQVVQDVLSHETSAYDLEKFTPEVISLCKRLSSIPVSSHVDSVSVAEMAKKTATILRSISILQATRTKNSSYLTTLTQSLKNLPMPHDYKVPEYRFVAHCFLDEITAKI